MPSTNQTPNLKLSQFTGSDKPNWRQDYNEDMDKIDKAYGSVSGESGELAQRVTALENDIPPINQSINGLQTSLNQTNVNANNIDTRVTTNENEISSLDARVDATENAISQLESADSWIIVGDSYGAGSPNYMSTLISLNPQQTIYNACKSGAGFTVTGNTFLQNLQAAAVSIQNKGRVGKIAVIGGGNDIGATEDSITTAISGLVQYCKSTFPNAQVFIGFLWGSTKGTMDITAKANCIINYKQGCVSAGANYIFGIENVCHRYQLYFGEDSTHPNARGAADIGGLISSFMRTNTPISISYVRTYRTLEAVGSWTLVNQAQRAELMKDGLVLSDPFAFLCSTSVEIPTGAYNAICSGNIIYSNPVQYLGEIIIVDTTDNSEHEAQLRWNRGALEINPLTEALKPNKNYRIEVPHIGMSADYC